MIFDTLRDSIADLHYVFATTARERCGFKTVKVLSKQQMYSVSVRILDIKQVLSLEGSDGDWKMMKSALLMKLSLFQLILLLHHLILHKRFF